MQLNTFGYYYLDNIVLEENGDATLSTYEWEIGGGLFPVSGEFELQADLRTSMYQVDLYITNLEVLYEYPSLAFGGFYFAIIDNTRNYVYQNNIDMSAFGADMQLSVTTSYPNIGLDAFSYYTFLCSIYTNEDQLNQSYQTALNSARGEGYTDGYWDGRSDGYQIGYDRGVQENGEMADTFTLLGGAFESVSGVLSTPLIGGLTIGGLLGIPLAITVVVIVFKMLRK